MLKKRIEILLQLLADNKATASDKEELYAYYRDAGNAPLINDLIEEYWAKDSFREYLTQKESEALYKAINQKIPVARTAKIYLKRWGAAAAVVAAIAAGWWFFQFRKPQAVVQTISRFTDIAPPATSNAVLLLADGSRETLNRQEGVITTETIRKPQQNESGYNTIFNPRGSKPISVLLDDGTRLWLNAESSLKYPFRFTAMERRVHISGEAYFEVAYEENRPFIVVGKKAEVKVLGTHFNINTFNNTRVTLLEGLVKVLTQNHKDSGLIRPGESAIINDAVKIISSDTTSAVAWKSELFDFKEMPLNEIMRELGRWYDADIFYDGPEPRMTLSGTVNRSINASRVLEILQLSSGMQFKIEGKKIIVKTK